MEPKGNPNVPGDRKINKKTAASSSATVKPNSKSPASSPIVSSALSMKSKAETALIHEEQGSYRPPIHAENPNVFKLLTDMRDTIGLHVKLLLHWVTFFRFFFK